MKARFYIAVAAVLALGATGCGGGTGADHSAARAAHRPTVTTAPAPTPTTLPPNASLIAQVTVPVLSVYDAPRGLVPSQSFANPWLVNGDARYPVAQVFLAETVQPDGWVKILLPIRPNGSTGWVHGSDVRLVGNTYRIVVTLSAHTITVFNRASVLYQGPVAIGAPATPTPTGNYFIRVLQQPPDPQSAYGPFAYGLSSHSDVLTTFSGGDGEIGIHGNDDASALGQSVSHGCVRMDNAAITQLSGLLPLGTPVDIVA